jgi:hypothetical protein
MPARFRMEPHMARTAKCYAIGNVGAFLWVIRPRIQMVCNQIFGTLASLTSSVIPSEHLPTPIKIQFPKALSLVSASASIFAFVVKVGASLKSIAAGDTTCSAQSVWLGGYNYSAVSTGERLISYVFVPGRFAQISLPCCFNGLRSSYRVPRSGDSCPEVRVASTCYAIHLHPVPHRASRSVEKFGYLFRAKFLFTIKLLQRISRNGWGEHTLSIHSYRSMVGEIE